jgi:6-phospho-beta-glucosidase
VGGIAARARDERLALKCGFAGQETTGPAGFAMALRTLPVALEQSRTIRKIAPQAWIINFTNPAGLITQAVMAEAGPRVVGICDTPAELFLRIAAVLGAPVEDLECGYFGLNHLGWVRTIHLRKHDVTQLLLDDNEKLRGLYGSELFPLDLIRSTAMIPSEYLFFYYRQRLAIQNQLRVGSTRGEELMALNSRLWPEIESSIRAADWDAVFQVYRSYVNRRNVSYLKLEAAGESAFLQPEVDWNPLDAAVGYHRIAVETMRALGSSSSSKMVLNVPNEGAIEDLSPDDIVEAVCSVDRTGARPLPVGKLPEVVRGLTIAVKTYERLTIAAARQQSAALARLALFTNPLVGDCDGASDFLRRLLEADSGLGTLGANAPAHERKGLGNAS